MKLSEYQQIFTLNVSCLIQFAERSGYRLTFGEAYRSKSQQILYFFGYELVLGGVLGFKIQKAKKLTKTLESNHLRRLAVDFNVFINGNLTYKWEDIKPLGDYWESLHEKNRWGGDFNGDDIKNGFIDTPHFEMNI